MKFNICPACTISQCGVNTQKAYYCWVILLCPGGPPETKPPRFKRHPTRRAEPLSPPVPPWSSPADLSPASTQGVGPSDSEGAAGATPGLSPQVQRAQLHPSPPGRLPRLQPCRHPHVARPHTFSSDPWIRSPDATKLSKQTTGKEKVTSVLDSSNQRKMR